MPEGTFYMQIIFFIFWIRVLCSPNWPWPLDFPVSTSLVLELKAGATKSDFFFIFLKKRSCVYSLGWPCTSYVAQVGLLLLTPIRAIGVCHVQRDYFIYYYLKNNYEATLKPWKIFLNPWITESWNKHWYIKGLYILILWHMHITVFLQVSYSMYGGIY